MSTIHLSPSPKLCVLNRQFTVNRTRFLHQSISRIPRQQRSTIQPLGCYTYTSYTDYRPVMQLGCDLASTEAPEGLEFATFAGGAFYGLELAFQRIHGVHETMVGYTQGRLPFPIYSIVLTGTTGHVFAVQVAFNPKEVSYSDLLEELFIHVDPTSLNQQRGDEGTFYRSGIYYHNEKQQQDATVKLKELQKRINDGEFRETYGEKIVVEIKAAGDFYVAEEFHQKYFENGGSSGPPQSVVKGCKDPILWDA